MIRLRHTAALAAASVLLAACDGEGAPPELARIAEFAEVYEPADTIVLEQSDSMPLILPATWEARADGVHATVDVEEGNVRLFRADGSLIRILGRKGQGPGEFSFPLAAHWDAAGRLHVLDLDHMHVAIFSPAGEFQRAVRLGKVGNAYDFAPLPDGGYLFLRMDDARELLARTDSAGRITRSFLPIADYVPPGLRNREAWRRAIAPIMRVHGDTALVALAPADSLWRVDLATGSATAFPIRPPDYPAPRDPEGSIGDTAVYQRWNESYTRVSGVVRVPGRTLVAFTRPVGDTIATTMVERADDGSLIALRNAPVMFVNDGGLPASLVAGETTAAIVRWRRRP